MIFTIWFNEALAVVASFALFAVNETFCADVLSILLTSAGNAGVSGQPKFLATPGTSGHLSSSSLMPSLSLSEAGQPLLLAGPASFGHLSSSSFMPSLSVSGIGHPLYFARPA